MASRRVACAITLLLLLGGVASAAHPRVERARRAYEELRFEDVLTEVAAARREGALTPADNAELTRLEAFTYAVFDDATRAVEAFDRLLRLTPDYTLPAETSPKIQGYFAQARERLVKVSPRPDRAPRPSRDKDPPFYRSGWFWGALVVAVGLGVGVSVLVEE